jgi:hypothetical protein
VKRLEPGESVILYLDARDVFLFDDGNRLVAADFAEAA